MRFRIYNSSHAGSSSLTDTILGILVSGLTFLVIIVLILVFLPLILLLLLGAFVFKLPAIIRVWNMFRQSMSARDTEVREEEDGVYTLPPDAYSVEDDEPSET